MLDFQHITQRQQRSSKKAAAEQASRPTGSPPPASEPVENTLEQDGKQRAARSISGRRRTTFQCRRASPLHRGILPKKKMSPSLLCGVGVCIHLVSRIADGLFTHQATTYPCKRYPHPSSLAGGFPFPYAFFKALYEDLKGECPPYGLTLWAESPIRVFPCRMTPV